MTTKERLCREQTTIRLPSELKEAIARQAAENGVSWNQMVLMILHEAQIRLQRI